MSFTKLPGNGAGSQITVTNTATSLLELIRTASGDASFEFKGENMFSFTLSNTSAADIRYFLDGNTPTTTLGELIQLGNKITRHGVDMNEVRLIVTTGTASVLDISIGTFSHGQPADNFGGADSEVLGGIAGLTPFSYDFFSNTYVTTGNGIGELETITYRKGGSGGTIVGVTTLTYDANDQLLTATTV